jgi:hypothetical protein
MEHFSGENMVIFLLAGLSGLNLFRLSVIKLQKALAARKK